MQYFKVTNFDKFQHYKDRKPPWIKLYNDILDDYGFSCLQDASKLHLVLIYLLASRSENKIPMDAEWIAKQISATERVDLATLMQSGFIEEIEETPIKTKSNDMAQDASNAIAVCEQNACLETETETETETEKDSALKIALCPVQQIIDLYKSTAVNLPTVRVVPAAVKKSISARWREDQRFQSIKFWEEFFGYCENHEFLSGRSPPRPGNENPFRASLDWIVKPSNFAKIINGNYDRATH